VASGNEMRVTHQKCFLCVNVRKRSVPFFDMWIGIRKVEGFVCMKDKL
jgi:hypothetical protein